MFKIRIKENRRNRRTMIAKSEMKLYISLLNYEKKIIKLSNGIRKRILFKTNIQYRDKKN